MNYVKEFVQKPNGEIEIKDKSTTDDFIEKKVQQFADINKFSNKDEILKLYKEITDMCEFDLVNTKIDTNIEEIIIKFFSDFIFS